MSLPCDVPGCNRHLKNKTGKTQHMRHMHPDWEPDPPRLLDFEGEEDAADPDMPPLSPGSDSDEGSDQDEAATGNMDEQPRHNEPIFEEDNNGGTDASDAAGDAMDLDDAPRHAGGTSGSSNVSRVHLATAEGEAHEGNNSPIVNTDALNFDDGSIDDYDGSIDNDDGSIDNGGRGRGDNRSDDSGDCNSDDSADSGDSDDSGSESVSDSKSGADSDLDELYDGDHLDDVPSNVAADDSEQVDDGEHDRNAEAGAEEGFNDRLDEDHANLDLNQGDGILHGPADAPRPHIEPTQGHPNREASSAEHPLPGFTNGIQAKRREVHPVVNGKPCTSDGHTLPPGSQPPPTPTEKSATDWAPFDDRVAFELADLLYRKEQMPAGNVNELLELWTASLLKHGGSPPFEGQEDLYRTIDDVPLGDIKWESFTLSYNGQVPAQASESEVPPWMTDRHSVFYRDPRAVIRRMLENPDFKDEIDYAPFREFDHDSKRRLQDFMGGEWAWRQANILSGTPDAQDSSFVPIILGSDKTTVSVATGQNEYYPVYCSIGNVHNTVRRAHRNAVALIGFLAIPKTNKRDANSAAFRKFRRQLFHTSLSRILQSLRPWMETPEVVRCGDGHFRKIIYGIGPYIADYPEQALLGCIVQGWCPVCMLKKDEIENGGGLSRNREHTEYLVQQFELGELWEEYGIVGDVVPFTNNFPRADIHELLAPDILHQLIKGTFKDHLVAWVEKYLKQEHGDVGASKILAQIDRRIATVPPFSKLRHFHEGRGFKQWTGDDSKALMKVYLPAIDGLLPPDIVKSIRHFLEFCYLIRRDSHTEETLRQIEVSLEQFIEHREFFRTSGVRSEGFSLPRQHSCMHYVDRIWDFGSPNGLCSSITESKHIKAVKEPWRRSSRYEALDQMLMTNQRLDKLAAARVDFSERGMLQGSCLSAALLSLDPVQREAAPFKGRKHRKKKNLLEGRPGVADDDGAVSGPKIMAYTAMAITPQRQYGSTPEELGAAFSIPGLRTHIRRFLYHELNRGQPGALSGASLPLDACPPFDDEPLSVYHSAASTFYAPSDPCGVGGMHREIIRANPSWRGHHSRFDCVFINKSSNAPGLLGMEVARVRMFFAFTYRRQRYPCAVVHWFGRTHDEVDEDTGMWTVKPSYLRGRVPLLSVINLNGIVRAAHLIGLSVADTVSDALQSHEALDTFSIFYVNKYVDHHAFELLNHDHAPADE